VDQLAASRKRSIKVISPKKKKKKKSHIYAQQAFIGIDISQRIKPPMAPQVGNPVLH
jgi:hypothetical protein